MSLLPYGVHAASCKVSRAWRPVLDLELELARMSAFRRAEADASAGAEACTLRLAMQWAGQGARVCVHTWEVAAGAMDVTGAKAGMGAGNAQCLCEERQRVRASAGLQAPVSSV